MTRRAHSTRPLQIGFLVLLAVCIGQVAWWLADQVEYTAQITGRLKAMRESEIQASRALLRAGTAPTEIARLYPSLVVGSDSASIQVSPEVVRALAAERAHRLNRYAWEGAFFLAVLVAAMVVVYRAIREGAELRRRQEDFLAAVSHELKSPLASARLSVETLSLRNPSGEQRGVLVGRLLEDLERLEQMIGNILEASRLSTGAPGTAPELLCLSDEVESVVAEVHEQASEHAVTLKREVLHDLTLRADRGAVRTVVRNLLQNAIRASRGGGNVIIRGAPVDGRVRLEVRDDGIGFPSQEATQLFQKFYRVSGNGREQLRGTGLGLFLVRRLAELDGGSVTAASEGENRGAVFSVEWPAAGDGTP
jgi:signal transduction histidine kinase